jgi:hypothetical protein
MAVTVPAQPQAQSTPVLNELLRPASILLLAAFLLRW